eukprot:m.26525 g.26525  ORF g.26525 m.26525 type:complete len:354 (-) comp11788_c0_seq1:165-1226(-)
MRDVGWTQSKLANPTAVPTVSLQPRGSPMTPTSRRRRHTFTMTWDALAVRDTNRAARQSAAAVATALLDWLRARRAAKNAPAPDGHMINPETDIQWIDGVPACARDILAHRAGGARVRAPGSDTAEPSVDLTLNPGEIPPALSDNPQIKAAQRKALKASAVAAALATPVPIEKGNFHLALDDGAYDHAREDDNVLRADFLWVVQIKTPPRRKAHRVSGLFGQQTVDAPNAVVIWWYAKTDEDACTQLQWLRDEGMDDKPPHASASFVKGGSDTWPTSLIGPRVELTDKRKLRKACRTTFADVLQRADEEYYLEGDDLDEDERGQHGRARIRLRLMTSGTDIAESTMTVSCTLR